VYDKQEELEIRIKYLVPDLPRIEKFEIGDWIDLRAAEDVVLKERESRLIPLGVAMQLPKGYEAQIAPRSGAFGNWGILQPNSPGIIDESYCGDGDEWKMSVFATREAVIPKGSRICHFRIVKKMPPVRFIEVSELANPDRGGFGSTGRT
jgi:dUTP pyrophosphatase